MNIFLRRVISSTESEFLNTIGNFLPKVRDVEWLGMAAKELDCKLSESLDQAFAEAGDVTRAKDVLSTQDYESLAAICRVNNSFLLRPSCTIVNNASWWHCRMVIMVGPGGVTSVANSKEYTVLAVRLSPPYSKTMLLLDTAESNYVKEQHYAKWVLHSRFRRALTYNLTSESASKNSVIVSMGILVNEAQKSIVGAAVESIRKERCWKSGMLALYFHYDLNQQLVSLLISVSGFSGTIDNNVSAADSFHAALQALGQPSIRAIVISYNKNLRLDVKRTVEPQPRCFLSKDRNRLLWCRFLITMLQPNAEEGHPRNRILQLARQIELATKEQFVDLAQEAFAAAKECYQQFSASNKDALKKHKEADAESMASLNIGSDTFKCSNIIAFVETYFWFQKMAELGDDRPRGLEESKWAAENFDMDPQRAYDVMSCVWEFLDRLRLNNQELGKLLSVCAESNLIDFLQEQKAASVDTRLFDVEAEGFHEMFSTPLEKNVCQIVPMCCVCSTTFSDDICRLHEWDCDWNHNMRPPWTAPIKHARKEVRDEKKMFGRTTREIFFQCGMVGSI